MDGAAETLDRVDVVASVAVADLLSLPGVRRVGLSLSEGGGRRLRFTASDRDNSASVDWCHIDAYDDVPLTTAVRTGESVVGLLDRLDHRYAGFVAHQRKQGTRAVAAVPLPGSASPMGAVILFYDADQPFDFSQRSGLDHAAGELAAALRVAQAVTPRDIPALADAPVEPGTLVADLTVEGDPRSVRATRRWALDTLADWGLDDDTADDAVLCLSELVTNAVIHTNAGCEIRLLLDHRLLTVTVRDRGGAHRSAGADAAADPLRVHGRGLQVVEALATRWSSTLDTDGATVWFALEAPGSQLAVST